MKELSHNVATRLTDNQYHKLCDISSKLNVSKSLALRAIVNGYHELDKYNDNQPQINNYKALNNLNKVYRVLYRDGNNLNQIARAENINGYASYSPQLIQNALKTFQYVYTVVKEVDNYGS